MNSKSLMGLPVLVWSQISKKLEIAAGAKALAVLTVNQLSPLP
jgi:hypothetical protein